MKLDKAVEAHNRLSHLKAEIESEKKRLGFDVVDIDALLLLIDIQLGSMEERYPSLRSVKK